MLQRIYFVEGIILMFLIACFSFQVKDSLMKYISGKSTVATTMIEKPGLEYPVISFCPGFKNMMHRIRRTYGKTDRNLFKLIDKFKVTRSHVEDFWNSITYKVSELLYSMEHPTKGKLKGTLTEGFHKEINVSIDKVSTTFGNCYSIKFFDEFPLRSPIRIKFNMSLLPELDLFLHEPFNEIGLYFNYWPMSVLTKRVTRNKNVDVSLRSNVWKSLDNDACEPSIGYSNPKCVLEWAKREYLKANCSNVCWLPHSQYITRELNLNCCVSEEDYICMSNYLYTHVIQYLDQTLAHGCKEPCLERTYTLEEREDPIVRQDNTSSAYIFYHTTTYPMEEEYLLYDFNAIISAVGGSLGLFLGFSCLNFFKMIINAFLESPKPVQATDKTLLA